MIPKTAFLAAVCGLLVGYTPITTPHAPSADPAVEAFRAEQRRATMAQHLASEDPDAKLPRITSVATMNQALASVGRNGGSVSNNGVMGMGKAVADYAQVMIGRLYLKAPIAMRVLVMNRKHL